MVFVKVRETYDLHTTKNKMTVIAIHTPKPEIIKRNYPGLLMQCKAYRPVSADVRVACASLMPLDVQSVGTAPGDVAPEDVFNPILYKAMSNFGMSQLEARITSMSNDPVGSGVDVDGNTAMVDVDSVTSLSDEFALYYGLLSETNNWKHASPQSGLEMKDLRPLVWEMVYNVGDNALGIADHYAAPIADGTAGSGGFVAKAIRGGSKPMPFINCTYYTGSGVKPGFSDNDAVPANVETGVPWINVVCGAIIIPPSRLHELFYRMVVEWTIEFSQIRSLVEIASFSGIGNIGSFTHWQNYNYESTKEAITGSSETLLDNDSCMVASNVDVEKVM